jgi:isoleucyl-tRNA synthetase
MPKAIRCLIRPSDAKLAAAQIVRNTADLIEKHGSNVWFEKSATELWSLLKPKDWKRAEAAAKSNDTLDVWIDSGSSSSKAVLKQRKELQHDKKAGDEVWQADMYLKAATSIAGGFNPRCCYRWRATAPRRSRPC